jgi:hypothetical protein
MATKTELIQQLEQLTAQDDVETIAEAVEGVKEAYEAIVAAAHQDQSEKSSEEPAPANGAAPVSIESTVPQDEHDRRFKQLMDAFNQRVNDLRRKRAKQEADNLAAKEAVMAELRDLIANEENIGNAFQRLRELQERWRSIGPVPQQSYRQLQSDYTQLLDEFFYHINIYKELRDNDLRKNTAVKQALVADMNALLQKDGIKELETLVKEYQDRWHQAGPVVREEWENLRDAFHTATRAVYDRIHEYYRARRAEHETNLRAKQDLVEKVRAITTAIDAKATHEWKALTDQVLELQNAWKQIGFATKKENERVWKEFRSACNDFFQAKKAHFDQLRDQYKAVRDRKQALIDEAIALKDSSEWKRTADRLKQLQQEWRTLGSAGPRDEQRLWNRFREACDAFFAARKATYDRIDAEQAGSVQAKEALIAEIEAHQLSGDRQKDLDTLKEFANRWLGSGRVSPKVYEALSTRYRAGLDKLYGQLRVEAEERQKLRFQNHVDELKSGPDGRDRIERESRFIKRKIEELEGERRQMEHNMGMFNFKSASGEAMRAEMEKRIERIGRDVERLKQQHRELLKELR